MRAGLEFCRVCAASERPDLPLTMDHIVALADGGRSVRSNLAILCLGCNADKGADFWLLPSLEAEEAAAGPERRWTELLYRDLAERTYPCPNCGDPFGSGSSRRLRWHLDSSGAGCQGSRTRVPDGTVEAILARGVALGPSPDRPVIRVPRPRRSAPLVQRFPEIRTFPGCRWDGAVGGHGIPRPREPGASVASARLCPAEEVASGARRGRS
ncbi:HNH endonuclease signature motif containing protein [Pseudonocardia alni]|uniref:HNH endonuclease signature motif containing protein n=1 Tax=Pseudonocardia alni TaxID=33907 RepID=UPI0033221BFF